MSYALSLVTAPAVRPVSLAVAKNHCRIDEDFTDEDAYLDTLIVAATSQVETITGRALITQTWDYKADGFPYDTGCPIELPKPKLQSVTSISYVDTNGTTQTWSSSLYQVDADSSPSRIIPAYGQVYPAIRSQLNAVTIRYVCGYGADVGSIPENIILALLAMVNHWYDNRMPVIIGQTPAEVPMSASYLLTPYRIFSF